MAYISKGTILVARRLASWLPTSLATLNSAGSTLSSSAPAPLRPAARMTSGDYHATRLMLLFLVYLNDAAKSSEYINNVA